mmetsp:Transcript_65528/g.185151  ORF Transcript_65528/g.185151 Transcript_65528/m.185151 type:complete len:235 (+) Transcript_65528:898-1602(+)
MLSLRLFFCTHGLDFLRICASPSGQRWQCVQSCPLPQLPGLQNHTHGRQAFVPWSREPWLGAPGGGSSPGGTRIGSPGGHAIAVASRCSSCSKLTHLVGVTGEGVSTSNSEIGLAKPPPSQGDCRGGIEGVKDATDPTTEKGTTHPLRSVVHAGDLDGIGSFNGFVASEGATDAHSDRPSAAPCTCKGCANQQQPSTNMGSHELATELRLPSSGWHSIILAETRRGVAISKRLH